jgi:hypothetical protein
VRKSPFGSVANTENCRSWFTCTDCEGVCIHCGDWLKKLPPESFETVTENDVSTLVNPSDTRSVTVCVPVWELEGTHENTRLEALNDAPEGSDTAE